MSEDSNDEELIDLRVTDDDDGSEDEGNSGSAIEWEPVNNRNVPIGGLSGSAIVSTSATGAAFPPEVSLNSDDDKNYQDDRLDDEDYDLLEENLGVRVKRRRRFKRLKPMVESDSEDNSDQESAKKKVRQDPSFSITQDDKNSSDSDSDNFIVDEHDRPIRQRLTDVPEYCDPSVMEAREIFGGNFDYGDIDAAQVEADSDEEENSDNYEESDEESQVSSRRNTNARPKRSKKELKEISFLKEVNDEAEQIRNTDLPERFQLRRFPVSATGSEVNREALWIFQQAFASRVAATTKVRSEPNENASSLPLPPTDDDNWDDDLDQSQVEPTPKVQEPAASTSTSTPTTIYLSKIKKIIKLIRDDKYEVPYIYFYQRSLTRPEFSLYDLWTIYTLDEEFIRMYERQKRLVQLFANMQAYQETLGEEYLDRNDVRTITKDDFDLIHDAKSLVELDDIQTLFLTYYADDVPMMKAEMEAKRKEIERLELEEGVNVELVEDQTGLITQLRSSGGAYRICKRNGIGRMLPLIGLTAEEFGENFEVGYACNTTVQTEVGLDEVLESFATARLKEKSIVATAAKHMLATNFSRDLRVKKIVRKQFFSKAMISVSPTRKGLLEIDENHPVFTLKFLKNKPVNEMDGIDFLELTHAEKSGLITMTIGDYIPDRADTGISLIEEAKSYFSIDAEEEPTDVFDEWKVFREAIVDFTFEKILYPEFRKELRFNLLKKASELIKQRCSDKVYSLIQDAPFTVNYEKNNDDEDWNTSDGIRVMGLAYEDNFPVTVVIVNKKGYVIKSIVLTYHLTRIFKGIMADSTKEVKDTERERLKEFIEETKPHVIVIGGESRNALILRDEIRELLCSFPQWEINFNIIPVHIIDNEVAKVYARTSNSSLEFPETTEYYRQAVSLCRYMQDPLLEVSQICNRDEDILCLHLNKYQHNISNEELLRCVQLELINRACETGVDLNDAVAHKHRSHVLQFVSGFGFYKATWLLRKLRDESDKIRKVENRHELVERCKIGPVVYRNAGGFLRIKDGLPEDAMIDPRDQTRIHPQYYDFALTVARASLSQEDEESDLSDFEIMEKSMVDQTCQENLLALDLKNYLEQLKEKGYGDLTLLSESIIAELLNPYHDVRKPFHLPDSEEMFYMLTKETFETIREAKLLTAYINDARWRKPPVEETLNVVPLKDPFNSRIICSYCADDFAKVEDLWYHYDTEACPGEIYALHIHFGNGITGLIKLDKVADDQPKPKELLKLIKLRLPIQVRILKVDMEKFFLQCTARTSDLQNPAYMPTKDPYYDEEAEKLRSKQYVPPVKPPPIGGYVRRNVSHPSYKNINSVEAEEMLKDMDQGDCIFRPSTKGFDVLTLTWKVAPDILQHVNIIETKKRSDYELGKCLSIGNTKFEDLDEIIARYVNPQAGLAREVLGYKYYKTEDYEDPEVGSEYLKKERENKPNTTPYVICASKKYPGRFILSFMPQDKVFQEVIWLTPDGIFLRDQLYQSIRQCMHYWKQSFKAAAEAKKGNVQPEPVDVSLLLSPQV